MRYTKEEVRQRIQNRKQSQSVMAVELEDVIEQYEAKQLPSDIDAEMELGYQDFDEERDADLSLQGRPF